MKMRTLIRSHPLLTASCALIVTFIMLLVIPSGDTPLQKLRQEIPLALLTMFLLFAIGGTSLVKFKSKGIGFTFKKSLLYLASGILGLVVTIIGILSPDTILQPNWITLLVQAAIFYLLLGIFEEGMFRGVILHAFLAKMGKTRRGVIGAVTLGAFIFGFAHVLLTWFQVGVDLSALGLMQALSKTLSAGMAGFFFSAMYLKTRNIWGVALVHGLSDFLLLAGSLIFFGTNSVSYVSSDPAQAMNILGVNTIFAVIYIPLIVIALRTIKTIELPELGFYEENWN